MMIRLMILWNVVVGTLCTHTDRYKVILLHNADVHARFDETTEEGSLCTPAMREQGQCIGGFPRIATVVNRMRSLEQNKDAPIVLYLFGGGVFVGTPWFSLHKAKIAYEMMNALKPDAIALAANEFNLDVEGLQEYVNNLESPVIAANLDVDKVEQLKGKILKSTVKDTGRLKIGIIGHITASTPNRALKIEGISFYDEVKSVKEEATALKDQGVDLIIALGNSGLNIDKRIATEVKDIDVVIGGMDKIFMYNGPSPSTEVPRGNYPMGIRQTGGKKVPIAHAYTYSKYMGCLNLTVDSTGDLVSFEGQPFYLSNRVEVQRSVLRVLDKFRPEVEQMQKEVVGVTRVILNASDRACSRGECNIGNLITDAFVEYDVVRSAGLYWTNTPIAFINSGAIEETINAVDRNGSITRADLRAVLPHGNKIVAFSVTGETLRSALEVAVRNELLKIKGEFLQFSGVQVTYDMSMPVGTRVIDLKLRCSACEIPKFTNVEESQIYNVVSNMFLLEGGDGYAILKQKHFAKIIYQETDVEIVEEYIKRHSPICAGEKESINISFGGDKKSRGAKVIVDNLILFIYSICMCYM